MSVIVKNMKMPKTCNDCGLRDSFDCWITDSYIEARFSKRNDDCPLVEIPTPHGDLVDRNKLLRKAKRESTYAWKMNLHARTETILNQFIDWLDGAKVIIEAEGETE